MKNPSDNLKLAERGALLGIGTYIVLAMVKIIAGQSFQSSSLIADGFNNASDIISNVALLIGIRLARRPADVDHRFGHWKIEDLASLITSIIMFYVGFDVLSSTVQKILHHEEIPIDPLGAWVGLISAIIMISVYFYNRNLAKRAHSKALEAAAKDNLSDALTSIGTSVAIFASAYDFPVVDQLAAIIITFFILKTAFDIFKDSTFSLSDGFDQSLLVEYEQAILEIPKIVAVKSQRGRTYGSNIYLDIILEMNPDLSVYESHEITEQVEQLLHERFNVFDIDIHVEPSAVPDDEILDNVVKKLYLYEKKLHAQQEYEELLADDFTLINEEGTEIHKKDLIEKSILNSISFKSFEVQSISQKTKLIRYEINQQLHTSIWRRHENWQLVHHQVTSKQNQDQDIEKTEKWDRT